VSAALGLATRRRSLCALPDPRFERGPAPLLALRDFVWPALTRWPGCRRAGSL